MKLLRACALLIAIACTAQAADGLIQYPVNGPAPGADGIILYPVNGQTPDLGTGLLVFLSLWF